MECLTGKAKCSKAALPEKLNKVTENEMMIKAQATVSRAILSEMSPLMKEQEESILSLMKADFRVGNLAHDKLVSHIAQLVVLEDLQNALKGKINRGRNLEDKK